jgi:integrase
MNENIEQELQMMTCSSALDWLETASLQPRDKRDIKSAIETACKWFKKTPGSVPLDPSVIRRLFKSVSPGGCGVTKKRFANVKSSIRRLLELMGIKSQTVTLSATWQANIALIDKRYDRLLLTRFGRFCSERQIAPCKVTDAIADDYRTHLDEQLRVSNPKRVHRETIRMWNRMAFTLPLWPKQELTLPCYSNAYTLPWSAFHPDFIGDVERYIAKKTTDDPFDLSAPIVALEETSVETYKDRIKRFASCLVLTGTEVSTLRSLDDLVNMECVERGLRYLANERSAKTLAGIVAFQLAMIARDHAKRPDAEVEAITRIAARLRKKRKGIAPKVRERLLPLKHEVNLSKLFLLPTHMARTLINKKVVRISDAQMFQRALALAILTVCPLRIGSLCSLRVDRHLHWSGGAMKGELVIDFGPDELKNDEPASFPIPKDVARLVRVYVSRFRPFFDSQESPFLFCGKHSDRPRHPGGLSAQITRTTFEKVGFPVNPHLYRHIVHLVVLRRFPGAYALVARVLTHRSIATTIQNYSHFDGEIAMSAFQQMVEDVQSGTGRKKASDIAAIVTALDQEFTRDVRR